ncbi:MAG: 16S rRNA (cytosine(1402)-N(4))-methyltransferase [Methylococcales bacterium]|nr:16S rRNA (cytosine(1402)-N(4))-methyltransferase [Methylococcales bacterium]
MTQRLSLTEQAHNIIRKHLKVGGIAIDATVGNGHDTLFLAKQVETQGLVFGFDIQKQAIQTARFRLEQELAMNNVKLIHASHSLMKTFIAEKYVGKINTIMFNLGYLPGSDKTVITETVSTLDALNQSIELLAVGGIITIAAYPGHPGGKEEAYEIGQWCQQLDPKQYIVQQINSSEKDTAPRLYTIQKI